ncbi:MAG: type II secretion system F family protein [Aquificae bacterium]|nr:type II secretion system F family protein [Aquificota bacterium]
MAVYLVEAVDTKGNKIKKLLNIEEDSLLSYLEFSHLTPIKIRQLPDFVKHLDFKISKKKIKRVHIIEILENLHLIVKSGIPLNVGIIDLAEDTQNPFLKDMLYEIAFKIQGGMLLSQAVEKYRQYFTDVVIALFKIGEETGNLDKTLKDAAEHLKRIDDIFSKTKQALLYPTIAVTAILSAIIFWVVYVFPKLTKLFKDLGIELPVITEYFLAVSQFVIDYGLIFITTLIIVIILIKVARERNTKFRLYTDKIILKIPVISPVLKNFYYAFFCEYLRFMIKVGLPINRALEILSSSIKNSVFKEAIKHTKSKIEEGYSLAQALKEEKIFPPLIIRMLSIGEQTGGLESQLEYISSYYYTKVDYTSQNIAKTIEPAIIMLVGIFLLVVIISILSPIYDLITKLTE